MQADVANVAKTLKVLRAFFCAGACPGSSVPFSAACTASGAAGASPGSPASSGAVSALEGAAVAASWLVTASAAAGAATSRGFFFLGGAPAASNARFTGFNPAAAGTGAPGEAIWHVNTASACQCNGHSTVGWRVPGGQGPTRGKPGLLPVELQAVASRPMWVMTIVCHRHISTCPHTRYFASKPALPRCTHCST